MRSSKRSSAEWITLITALGILLTVIGLIGYSWLTRPEGEPWLAVHHSIEVRGEAGPFHVPFEVVNTGGETAEAVQVIAELEMNGEVRETGEQLIDFLSRKEKAEGVFIFSQDPRQGKVRVRVASYKRP